MTCPFLLPPPPNFCVISIKFMESLSIQKEPPPPPPQLPFSAHKKQVKKRMTSVGVGRVDGGSVFCGTVEWIMIYSPI